MAPLSHSLRRLIAIACLFALLLGAVPVASAHPRVGLIFFRAIPTNDGRILVEWETATELDLVGFRLRRGLAPAGEFSVMETLPGQGNAVTGAAYSYLDSEVFSLTRYYYLLEAIGGEGTVERLALTSAGGPFVQYLPLVSIGCSSSCL